MSDDLKVKAIELAAHLIGNLKGRAKELYESSVDARAMVVRVARLASELALELVATTDPARRDSITESLHGIEDTIANEVAAVAQDAATEAADALEVALQTGVALIREAAPLIAQWAKNKIDG